MSVYNVLCTRGRTHGWGCVCVCNSIKGFHIFLSDNRSNSFSSVMNTVDLPLRILLLITLNPTLPTL